MQFNEKPGSCSGLRRRSGILYTFDAKIRCASKVSGPIPPLGTPHGGPDSRNITFVQMLLLDSGLLADLKEANTGAL